MGFFIQDVSKLCLSYENTHRDYKQPPPPQTVYSLKYLVTTEDYISQVFPPVRLLKIRYYLVLSVFINTYGQKPIQGSIDIAP